MDRQAHFYGEDPQITCLSGEAHVLCCLGYVDQARARVREALALAEAYDHVGTMAQVLGFASGTYQRCHDVQNTLQVSERLLRLIRRHGPHYWLGIATLNRGWALFVAGRRQTGLAEARRGLAAIRKVHMCQPRFEALVAELRGRCGEAEEALAKLSDLRAAAHRSGEMEWAAEIVRAQGDLYRLQGDESSAETAFEDAIALAQAQQAKLLELRATVHLSRLWQAQGRTDEAWTRLSTLYGWFSEGFDAPDLVAARTMLEEMKDGE
jgi:ATP/maltotriose-dependent transcriptional regulator MalT